MTEVALEPGKTLRTLQYCREGKYNLCPDVVFFATPPVDGVFQEYVAHRSRSLLQTARKCLYFGRCIDRTLGCEAFMQPIKGNAHAGQTALVFGAGCIGLVSMMALKGEGV